MPNVSTHVCRPFPCHIILFAFAVIFFILRSDSSNKNTLSSTHGSLWETKVLAFAFLMSTCGLSFWFRTNERYLFPLIVNFELWLWYLFIWGHDSCTGITPSTDNTRFPVYDFYAMWYVIQVTIIRWRKVPLFSGGGGGHTGNKYTQNMVFAFDFIHPLVCMVWKCVLTR